MSDTPETEKAEFVYNGIEASGYVEVKFAQKLERERDQWRKCAERLAKYTENYYEEWGWSCLDSGEEALAEFEKLKKKAK